MPESGELQEAGGRKNCDKLKIPRYLRYISGRPKFQGMISFWSWLPCAQTSSYRCYRAAFIKYNSGNTNIQTRSTKCQYSPVVSTWSASSQSVLYPMAITIRAIMPEITCIRCSPVILKNADPNTTGPPVGFLKRPQPSSNM